MGCKPGAIRAGLLLAAGFVALRPGCVNAVDAPSREQLRSGVAADGRLTDGPLREQTGWRLIRAFEWRIELADPSVPGKFTPADAATTFRNGQSFRLAIEPYCDLYFYVLSRNADGSDTLLLPDISLGEKPALLKKGQRVYLPGDGETFRFDPPAGAERIRLLASAEPLPWATAPELLEIKSGAQLTQAQQGALAQLKEIRSRQARAVIQRGDKLPQLKGLGAALKSIDTGARARGCEVVILERAAQGELVTYTSSDERSTAVLTHEVVLQHGE